MTEKINLRWSPSYDQNSLKEYISALVQNLMPNKNEQKPFYALHYDPLIKCQGDIVFLDCGLPYIDENGQTAAESSSGLWLFIGNTCDFSRKITDAAYSQLIPITEISEISKEKLFNIRTYSSYRNFYLPPISINDSNHYSADFARPVNIQKEALQNLATLKARMTIDSWTLFHSCLIRFLARDDGREE